MCGLVGYYSIESNPDDIHSVVELVAQAKIRGLHAFGVTLYTEDGVRHSAKFFEFDDLVNYIFSIPNISDMIVHTRYSTSGDWQDLSNNQPVNVGGYSLVFNGVISMKTKADMESDICCAMDTDNDGELFIRSLMAGVDPVTYVQNMAGSFAGLWYDDDGQMFALRNERRPLWQFCTNTGVFYASTVDVIKRALGEEISNSAVPCEPGKLMVHSVADDIGLVYSGRQIR